jgi:hypothetical protein
MKTAEFNIATLNVRSVLHTGKIDEIADELEKYNIQITALQEVFEPINERMCNQIIWCTCPKLFKSDFRPESNSCQAGSV